MPRYRPNGLLKHKPNPADSHSTLSAAGQCHTDRPVEHDGGEQTAAIQRLQELARYRHSAHRGRRKSNDEEIGNTPISGINQADTQ